jgi:hypothetical protein
MSNIFIIAAVVSIVFLIENKPLKILIRDALVVYFSVVAGYFILSQLDTVIHANPSGSNITPVFTDNPGF